jgi:hypothetical protein
MTSLQAGAKITFSSSVVITRLRPRGLVDGPMSWVALASQPKSVFESSSHEMRAPFCILPSAYQNLVVASQQLQHEAKASVSGAK